jgi:DNA-binding CsgD family transcriptional regulator
VPTLPRELLELHVEGRPLSQAETRVLRRLAHGLSGPETADALGVSYNTVRKQIKTARAKLRANTATQAVAIAVSLDLI